MKKFAGSFQEKKCCLYGCTRFSFHLQLPFRFHLHLWPNRSSDSGKKQNIYVKDCAWSRQHDGTYSYFSNTRVLPKEKWITWWFKSLIRDMNATLTFFLLYRRWPTKTGCSHDRTITQQLNKISKISYFSSNHIQQLSYIINICWASKMRRVSHKHITSYIKYDFFPSLL